MSSSLEIQLIAVIVSVACAMPGAFLVLRKLSMMTDSITHTILLGIVLAFFITEDLNSPFLIVGAALMGVATVWLTELLASTKLLSGDSAIGVVFPLLFSIAIILITRYADSTHLCVDSVLLGELAFAPFNRLVVFGVDIGAKALYTGGALLIANLVFVVVLFKELKIATFDPMLAGVMGISPVVMHYALMTMISFTTVASFEAVGSILVIAFMIGPPVTAYLLTDDLKKLLLLSALFGGLSGITGFQLAFAFDVSIAGSMAIMTGVIFAIVFVAAPKRGLVSIVLRRRGQKKHFARATLLLHLYNHQDTPEAFAENGIDTICDHLFWERTKLDVLLEGLLADNTVVLSEKQLCLTPAGIKRTEQTVSALLKVD